MKKVIILLLVGASVLSLAACTPKQYERQSKQNTVTSSSVEKEKKDTGQKYYQEVLERQAKYDTALKNGDKSQVFAEIGKLPAGSEENTYIDALEGLETPVTFQYAFTDLNQDGVDELLVSNQYTGNKQYVSAIYYLKGQEAELLHTTYTAPVGGFRSSLEVFENGQIVYATWQSINPEMRLTFYSLGKGEAKEEKKATIQIGGKETAEQALSISAKKLDISKLDWKTFDGLGNSKSTASRKQSSGMNIQEIQKGDFLSIAGTWRNGRGWILKFNKDGLTGKGFIKDGSGVVDNINPDHGYISGEIHSSKPNTEGGSLISFLPAGTPMKPDGNHNSDPSDTSKDRIWTGQTDFWDTDSFYYRVD